MADLIKTGYISAQISIDEDSHSWQGTFALANAESYARCQIGDAIELEIMGETYALRVDSRNISREFGRIDYTVTAMSPLGFLDAPWASEITLHYADPADARTSVEAILSSSVTWHLPTWTIPAGALSMTGVSPLQAAKAIVEAVGGVIESFPHGGIHCRLRDPVNIPDYATAAIDHYFTDADWITVSAVGAPMKGFNRVTISNSTATPADNTDKLEVVDDPKDGRNKLIRAYLSVERPVSLVHTGSPDTMITPKGVVIRAEPEVIEFVNGKASLIYPALSINSFVWQHANLGVITIDGTVATSSVPGYSLAEVVYSVQTTDFEVSLSAAEEVQFLLVDQS